MKDINIIIKKIDIEGGLNSQVVIIRCFILKTKVMKETQEGVEDQRKESAINSQNGDINDMDSDLVKDK